MYWQKLVLPAELSTYEHFFIAQINFSGERACKKHNATVNATPLKSKVSYASVI